MRAMKTLGGCLWVCLGFEKMALVLLPALMLLFAHGLMAQEPEKKPEEKLLEQLLPLMENKEEGEETDSNLEELMEELDYLKAHPIDINKAKERDLKVFFFLNEIQIAEIIRHREKFGDYLSLAEFQSLESLDMESLQMLLPFVKVYESAEAPPLRLPVILRQGKHQYFLRVQQVLETKEGYRPVSDGDGNTSTAYAGSPLRLYNRYRFTYYNQISLGITAEKDPGEAFFRSPQPYGFDFYSAHFFYQRPGRIRTLAFGDFQVQWGQGLIVWSGYGFGKSPDAGGVKKNARGLRPFTSVEENDFFRGAGAEVQLGRMALTVFASAKRRDANVSLWDEGSGDVLEVSSLPTGGLHRTRLEYEKKNQLGEKVGGLNVNYRKRGFHAGISVLGRELEADLIKKENPYNQYDFQGRRSAGLSLDYGQVFRNVSFFGESALSSGGGSAHLHGMMLALGRSVAVSLVGRSFSRDYHAWYASAFSENSRVVNEQGLYLGLQVRPVSGWSLFFYADHFRFPWLKYRVYMPSYGSEYLVQLNRRFSRTTEMYVRYRYKSVMRNLSESPGFMYQTENLQRHQLRWHAGLQLSSSIAMRTRIEAVWVQSESKKLRRGGLMYQDLLYRSLESPWDFTLRYALFDAPDFDARLYAYENDVLYAFSFPFYYGRGSRAYFLIKYQMNRSLDFWLRISQTFYPWQQQIGSGNELIDGNTSTEVKFQMRMKW